MLTPPVGITVQQYCTALATDNPTHVRIVFPVQDITFTDDDIVADGGITITSAMNADTDMRMGTSSCSEIVITFFNSSVFNNFDWEEEFHVDFGVEISGTTQWVTVGYFTGSKPERNIVGQTIRFTAYDRMKRFDVPFVDFVNEYIPLHPEMFSETPSMDNLCNHICDYVGMGNYVLGSAVQALMEEEYGVDVTFYYSNRGNETTLRNVIEDIAEANCCYAKIDQNGDLKFYWFTQQSVNPREDNFFEINISDMAIPCVGDVYYFYSSDPEGSKVAQNISSTKELYLVKDNPWFMVTNSTQQNAIKANISTRFLAIKGYHPVSVSAIGNWLIETGDIIPFRYDGTNNIKIPIFYRTFVWNGGCSDTYECTGQQHRSDNDEYLNLNKNTVVDNLTSADSEHALSANQGKVLNETKTDKTHILLGTFATETALNTALDTELGLMENYTVEFIRFIMSSATTNFRANHYYGTLSRPGSAINGILIVSNVSTVIVPVNGARTADGWVYKKIE